MTMNWPLQIILLPTGGLSSGRFSAIQFCRLNGASMGYLSVLFSELVTDPVEPRYLLRGRRLGSKAQEHLERRCSLPVVELHAQRVDAGHVARLLDGEGRA